ncbi:MAG: hypothetical protein U0Y10_11700 [Spirosomataceae bacterium]
MGATKGFSQDKPPPDFFASKWEISVAGTPNGDIKFSTELTRKEGELKDVTGQLKEAISITNIDEAEGKITIYCSAQGYDVNDVNIELNKVDDDNLDVHEYV